MDLSYGMLGSLFRSGKLFLNDNIQDKQNRF